MYKILVAVLAVILAVFLISKSVDNFRGKANVPAATTSTAPKTPAPGSLQEIRADHQLGPAGLLVSSFFKNWKYQRYAAMHAQMVNTTKREDFVQDIENNPLNWKNPAILSETKTGGDWRVTVSVEVTDLTSAFAACRLNLKLASELDALNPIFKFSPAQLGIEQFMTVKQDWNVASIDNGLYIDLGINSSSSERKDNIVNYFMDSDDLGRFLPGDESDKGLQVDVLASIWMAKMIRVLGKTTEDGQRTIRQSAPLYRAGFNILSEYVNSQAKLLHYGDSTETDRPSSDQF